MTVLFGPDDALYGTGRFGAASYGTVSPTKIVTGVDATLFLGDIAPIAEANVFTLGFSLDVSLGTVLTVAEATTLISGFDLNFGLGDINVRSINSISVEGVSAFFSVGSFVVEGGTGSFVTASSLPLHIELGNIKPNITTFAQGVSASFSVNEDIFVSGNALFFLTGYDVTFTTGTIIADGVVFNLLPFADNYSRSRTILLPKADTRSDRTARTEERY